MQLLARVCHCSTSALSTYSLQMLRLESSYVKVDLSRSIEVLNSLGFSENESEGLLSMKCLTKVKPDQLQTVADLLQKNGFTVNEIRKVPEMMAIIPSTFDHRFKSLEEIGIPVEKITLNMVKQYYKYLSMKIGELDNCGLLCGKTDIAKNVLSYTDLPVDLHPSIKDKSSTILLAKITAMETYIHWKFNFTKEEFDKRSQRFSRLFIYKSIRIVMESFNFLVNNVGLDPEKIKSNIDVLHIHPEKFINFLERIPFVGNISILEIAQTYPLILMRPVDKVLEILEILKEYDIPAEVLKLHTNIITLKPATVRERLEHLSSDEFFKQYLSNPRICKLIIHYGKVIKRNQILKDSKWRCPSFEIISTPTDTFNRRFKQGSDITVGCDIVNYIKKEMKLKREEIRKLLNQHPLWCYVPLSSVISTLNYLKQSGFHQSQIHNALPILLYQKSEVEKHLKLLDTQPEVDCCRDPKNGKIVPNLVLQLVLYYMERPFHFTGNGIWLHKQL